MDISESQKEVLKCESQQIAKHYPFSAHKIYSFMIEMIRHKHWNYEDALNKTRSYLEMTLALGAHLSIWIEGNYPEGFPVKEKLGL